MTVGKAWMLWEPWVRAERWSGVSDGERGAKPQWQSQTTKRLLIPICMYSKIGKVDAAEVKVKVEKV